MLCSDTSPFSVVGFDQKDKLIGFLSISSAPPSFVDGSEKFDINGNRLVDEEEYSKVTQINWADWISTQWEVKEIQVNENTYNLSSTKR